MAVKTKKVEGRRAVRYESLDEVLADAKQQAAQGTPTIGNWSQGQIYEHLAKSMHGSIDGMGFAMPAPVRFLMSALMKKKFLGQGLPAGFATNKKLAPEEVDTGNGLEALEKAVQRLQEESSRAMHPIFGRISNEEWNAFHLRHAEMHMSFISDEERRGDG